MDICIVSIGVWMCVGLLFILDVNLDDIKGVLKEIRDLLQGTEEEEEPT